MATPTRARRRTLAEKVDPRNTALVVIDMQNDFCHPDGYFGKRGADLAAIGPTAAKIKSLVEEARRLEMLIIWVRAHYDDINTGAPEGAPACVEVKHCVDCGAALEFKSDEEVPE